MSEDPPPRLRMEGIRKRFGPTLALRGVDLEVRDGQVLALVGENGAGKSTLMRILAGALAPDAGRMHLGGAPFSPASPRAARAAGVGMIHQELSLAPHLSVMENILLGVEPRRGPFLRWRALRERAGAAMRHLGRADIPLDRPAGALPVAEQQLVEIARALALGCRVLVLDEPTSSLGRADIERLFERLRELRDRGHAIIYISHFLEEITAITDRYTVLRDGASVGSGLTREAGHDHLLRLMVGREMGERYPRSARTPGPVVLETRRLAGRTRPTSATLALRRGQILGLAGLMGAGRTELLRALFGLDPVRGGTLRVAAVEGPASPRRRWRQGAGYVSEDRKGEGLAVHLSLAENLTLPRLTRLGPPGLFLPARRDRAARHWIEQLGIRCHGPGQPVRTLSGGNQQKIALARLLHAEVDILLLDEPTRGIDVGAKAEIYKLVDRLAAGDAAGGRPPCAVLWAGSDLAELLAISDRIAVMCRGRLGPAHPVETVDAHRLMQEATGAPAPETEPGHA